jgi:uncharacterized membrane protein YeaQ/YmgE (transglycosylase-associated protein family)
MTLIEFLVLLLIAGICGAVAQAITGFSRGGCLASIGVGLIGALLGTWIARTAGLPELFTINVGGTAFPIVWSILGAVILVVVISLVMRKR